MTSQVLISLTGGNVRNAHFYLARCLDFFPADVVGGPNAQSAGTPVTLELPDGKEVRTDIAGDKKIFRERGWVRSLFRQTDAQPEDCVLLTRLEPYRYRVALQSKPRVQPAQG